MSQILFQGNNLVVTGELGGEYTNVPLEEGQVASPENLRRTLFLNFIIQMNGKMIVHKEAYCLTVDKTSNNNPELEEWSSWYALCNIFVSFGYYISEDKNTLYNTSGIIRDWIDKLIQSQKNQTN